MKRFFFIMFSCLQTRAACAEPVTHLTTAMNSAELIRVVGGLLLVITIIVLLSWLLKRLNTSGFGVSKGFTILASMNVGTKEKIVLIKAGTRFLLLGVTPGSINTLHDFGEQLPAGFTACEPQKSFADLFRVAMRKSPQ